MSLRQLFSTDYAKSQLSIAYLGPVISPTGSIQSSPDAFVLDMRKSPYRTLRCEFKFIPSGKKDFSHNGSFDIAIIWSFGTVDRDSLQRDLLDQNGCSQILALSDFRAFTDLADYSYQSLEKLSSIDILIKLAKGRELHSVVAAYILSRVPDRTESSPKIIQYLAKKFASVQQMKPQGRGNIISAFVQTKPPLIKHMNQDNYR